MMVLDRLVNVLGGYGVRLCCCPLSRSTELRGVVLQDCADDRPVTGDVYLAVGAESELQAIRRAQAAGEACGFLEELLAEIGAQPEQPASP